MKSRKEGKIIAGQILINELGREYLIENRDKISTMESQEEHILQVDFYVDNRVAGDIKTEYGGIKVDDSYFPDMVLSVLVDLRDGTAKINKN